MKPPSAGPTEFALVIGAMKSGTTSLFEILAQHPEIAPCSEKEPDFFSQNDKFARGWSWYRDLWSLQPGQRVALEASVSYTKAPMFAEVPQRIASMPDARFRFVYMVRHPLRRIESQAKHSLFEGWGKSLDEGITPDLIDFTRYATQADRYMALFPRDALLVVVLEEFEADPRPVLRRICEFLGIDPSFEFADPDRKYNKGDLFNLSQGWAKILRGGPLRRIADAVLPRALRHRIRDLLTGAGEKKKQRSEGAPAARTELNAEESRWVIEQLKPDLRRLRDHYGVPFQRYWQLDID